MKRLSLILFPVFLFAANSPFEGRWDLTVHAKGGDYPSWLEVKMADGQPKVRIQGRVASVHRVEGAKMDGSKLVFSTQEWFGKQIPVEWEFTAADGKLTGTQKRSDGVKASISGEPAPALDRPAPKSWTDPKPLFNGKDLAGWHPDEPAKNHWKVINGEMVNEKGGANLYTNDKFQDFKLHLEYSCPELGNSGVYLRGRYEIQVEYEKPGTEDAYHTMGAIYGMLKPSVELPRKAGEWETLDATLVGRRVTVIRNGTKIIDNQEILGITGGAVDSHEAEPGPIYIQGDHTGGLKYRNISISLPKQ